MLGDRSVPCASSVTAGTLAAAGSLLVVSMDRLLRYFLKQFIRRGSMTFTTASGAKFTCGDGTGEPVSARFLTSDGERRILLNPELALGELYMEGTFVVERGSIADVLAILLDQPEILPRWAKLQWWLRYLVRHARQFNLRGRSKNNVARHYDLDGRLYSLFLDADKQYSCAYFETPDASLDDAQLAKKRHLAAKLLIGHGDRVLDIGCGWGGLGLYLAEMTGADVTGITLSTEQLQVANARAAEKKLARSARFLLQDYRDVSGPFDRIVARREEAVQIYDERFARMWEFYLAASEMAFRKQNLMNFQIQLTKRQGVVPMTRDYVVREEAKLRGLERGSRPQLKIAGE